MLRTLSASPRVSASFAGITLGVLTLLLVTALLRPIAREAT